MRGGRIVKCPLSHESSLFKVFYADIARPPGLDYPDAFYHVLLCGNERSDIFWKRCVALNIILLRYDEQDNKGHEIYHLPRGSIHQPPFDRENPGQ